MGYSFSALAFSASLVVVSLGLERVRRGPGQRMEIVLLVEVQQAALRRVVCNFNYLVAFLIPFADHNLQQP